jgi:hypothetical protein
LGELNKVSRKHGRWEAPIEVARGTQLEVLNFERVVTHGRTVNAAGITLMRGRLATGLSTVDEVGGFALANIPRCLGASLIDALAKLQ